MSNRSLQKDLEEKIITDACNGIPEYWVIDLKNKKLIVHTQPQNSIYLQVAEYKSETITPQAFTDINIDLSKLLLY